MIEYMHDYAFSPDDVVDITAKYRWNYSTNHRVVIC